MNTKYIQKWENKINEIRETLIKEDFNSYDNKMLELNNLYEQYKKDILLTYECTNFGMAKYIFENNLKDLFLTKKNAVKEYINTVKTDKNLTIQSHLFEALSNYNDFGDSVKFTNDVFDLALSNIDKKTLNESNQKIFNIIKKYDIKPNDFISHDKLSFFEQCDYILKNEKKIHNINEMQSVMSLISEHVRNNSKKHLNESNFNLNKSIAEFENKISSKLNYDEIDLIKSIVEQKDENKLKEIFESFKSNCINTVNEMIVKDDNVDLKELKNQIESKSFNQQTLIEDIVKFIDINDILND